MTGLVVAFALVMSAMAPARAETRTLKIYYVHTGEKADIAFKRDGHYLSNGLRELNHILRDWRRNEVTKMDPRLFDLLWAVYQKAGSDAYINVICGYRAPETNAMLHRRTRGVANKSQHMLGRAMDFYIPGVPLAKLRAIGLKMQVGGVGYYPTSGSPFVHMDVGGVRHWPRMNRQQLLALFPNGRTLHIPSDGKPLPEYEQALADYRARGGEPPNVQMASASGRKHKGFFASLFGGGGADEEEDNSEAVTVASAEEQPRAKRTSSPAALPGVESTSGAGTSLAAQPDMPATATALLPQRAPRPEIGVGGEPALEVAMNIPLPTQRPDYGPPPELRARGETVVASSVAYGNENDEIAKVLARESARLKNASDDDTSGGGNVAQAFAGPLPTSRPEQFLRTAAVATLPQPRPELLPERRALRPITAVFKDSGNSARGGRLIRASASQRLALLKRSDATDPIIVVSSGTRTTGKEGRAMPSNVQPKAKATVVPVPKEIALWAVQSRLATPRVKTSDTPMMAYNYVRTEPRIVYADGFRHDDAAEDPHHFTGKAVRFLATARFEAD